MFITRMNKFFDKHGRWTIGLFTIVIIFAFVLYFAPGFSLMGLFQKGDGGYGRIMGREVSRADIEEQARNAIISYALRSPAIDTSNRMLHEMASKMAIERLFMVRAAEARGILVDDKAVKDSIRSNPYFQTDGDFDAEKFNSFFERSLAPMGCEKEELDKTVREDLAVERLHNEIMSSVLVTDSEIRQIFNNLYEKLTVSYAVFSYDDFLSEVKIDDARIESFFNANRDSYTVPASSRAQIIRFNYIDFEGEALASVTKEEVKKRYGRDKEDFKLEGKDSIRPLAEVAAEIKKEIAEPRARDIAAKKAKMAARDIYKSIVLESDKEPLELFTAYAEENGLEVYETGWVAADAEVISRVGPEPKLAAAISRIDPDLHISDAVLGKKAAFIALLKERRPERPAELNDLREQVVEDYRRENALRIAREKVRSAAMEISEQLDSGKTFDKIDAGVKFTALEPFDITSGAGIPDGDLIERLAMKTDENSLAPATNTPDGAVLVYLEKRELPPEAEFQEKKAFLERSYRYQKGNLVWGNFLALLRSKAQVPHNKP